MVKASLAEAYQDKPPRGLDLEPYRKEEKEAKKVNFIPEFCTRYRNEALKPLCLKRSWSNFDPQAYYLYGEDQNYETSFKDKGLQAAVDSWCKIQVINPHVDTQTQFSYSPSPKK